MISVIIPVYNGEKTVGKCLTSLLKQTYTDLEIIVIDDGSDDATASVVNTYSKTYTNIHYYWQANQGVSVARNNGISISKGEFLLFVDADDWVEPSYVKCLHNAQIRNDADFTYSNWLVDNGKECCVDSLEAYGFDTDESAEKILEFYIGHRFGCASWGKLYKRNIIINNKISFDIGLPIAEDYLFILKYLIYSDKISHDDNANIHYIYNAEGANYKVRNDYPELQLKILNEMNTLDSLTKFQYNTYFSLARLKSYCHIIGYLKRTKNNRNDWKVVFDSAATKIRHEGKQLYLSQKRYLTKSENIICFFIFNKLDLGLKVIILLYASMK